MHKITYFTHLKFVIIIIIKIYFPIQFQSTQIFYYFAS